MALFVHVCEACLGDAQKHGFLKDVQRLQEQVESTQSTSVFDNFPPPYLVKKKLGGRQGRLIAQQHFIGEHAVVVCLAIIIRGNRAYDEFSADPVAYGKKNFDNVVSELDIDRLVAERTAGRPAPVKPDPSDAEYALLYGGFSHHTDASPEELVCETQEWVEQVNSDRISKQLALLCAPCRDAVGKDTGLHYLEVPGKAGWGIWALRAPGHLLLVTPSIDRTRQSDEVFARRIAGELEGQGHEAILKASRRAYPALILADDELWIDLEREQVANMALSPEESDVLASARNPDHPFPLFINGRAGSGKSTILQYLFSDLLYHYLSKPELQAVAPPVYLTANGELLRVARTFVERLLKNEAAFAQSERPVLPEECREILDAAFCEFQPHLLSLVSADTRSGRFARGARVDYSRFRRLWMERFGKDAAALRQFSPDLCWHVIRTYIKGISSETYLEPDDYSQLPENQLTVTHAAFADVHKRVWEGWYAPLLDERGLWDDQDLTRFVLDEGLVKPTYPAIFCDEAQDFTRLELELLLRLNLFSDRTIQANDIGRVPFAFAGDQFQTLNPTGFRWDAIKASFVEKFIFELDPARRSGRADLNYRELEFNYRSTDKIVRFGNHVQALRGALFGLPDLKPQTPWASQPKAFPVVWFRANDGEFWKRFRDQPGFVVIVPCNEGEEADYVSRDPVLREHIRVEDGVPLNVLSAGRAKGCEYPAVIVYGFGEAAGQDLVSKLTEVDDEARSDPDKTLPLQYFINRLYVAVSRAKRRLVIVDTDKGFQCLWRCAQDEAAEQEMLDRIKHGHKVWAQAIDGMTVGNPEDLTKESAGDPLENARAFEADGLAKQDPFLMRQAASQYRSAGESAKARECRARALDFEERHLEAGDSYFEAGFAKDGIRCYWNAGKEGWEPLRERVASYPQIQSEIEYRMVSAILGKVDAKSVAEVITAFSRRLDDENFASSCAVHSGWREALGALLSRLSQVADASGHWDAIAAALEAIRNKGVRLPATQAAAVFYAAARYRDAIACWEESGATRSPEYLRAKAAVEPYPQNIATWAKLGLSAELRALYSENPSESLTADQAAMVVDSLLDNGQVEDAFGLAQRASTPEGMARVALHCHRNGRLQESSRALLATLLLLVAQNQWEAVGTFAATRKFTVGAEWKDDAVRGWVESEVPRLQVLLVQAVARADGLPAAPPHLQRQVNEFLRQFLRIKDGAWKGRVTPREAGAALERTGRFTDAVSFYEAVQKDESLSREWDFARRRWLVCKGRHLEHERAQGATNKVNKIESEIRRELDRLGLASTETLERFPELAPLSPIQFTAVDTPTAGPVLEPTPEPAAPEVPTDSALPEQTLVMVGRFKIEVSRKMGRCNITDTTTMQTAFVKVAEGRCGGEMDFSRMESHVWTCDAWGITVRFPSTPGGGVVVDVADAGVGLTLYW